LVWTDPFHPGFELKIKLPAAGEVRDYWRAEDFQTGEVAVHWRDDRGSFERRLFVSRPADVIVLALRGPGAGRLTCTLAVPAITNRLVESQPVTDRDGMACHNVYRNGKGGYDSALRVVCRGGQAACDGEQISIRAADEVLVLMRIAPWKQAGESNLPALRAALAQVPADYGRLLAPHAAAHGAIFNRVALDLNGGADRKQPTEVLLERAAKEGKPAPALLEKMYDAGRYMFICASGERPPNLQGIWTGTWKPDWSGDYTLDTNLQAAIGSALSANMAEGLEPYFRLLEEFIPDCRENARKMYGCRGILTNSRASNNCLMLHWGWAGGWPGQFWTAGAGWLSHWFYDYYLYTGDRKFLAERAVPYLKEVALFYEDFLFVDDTGKYRFSPAYSPETDTGDNPTMDVAVAKEVLRNLVSACEALNIEPANVRKWQAMLARMPAYRINEKGELSEWCDPGHAEQYGHRHHSGLYPVFQSHELTPEADPALWQAARAMVTAKIRSNGEQSSFGRMQAGLAAAYLGMGEEAYGRLAIMATRRSMYPSLITSHEPDDRIFNTDGNGSIPELVNSMLVFSLPGRLDLLPALPEAWPRGAISGLRARGALAIDRLAWDRPAGRIQLELTAASNQTLTVRLPPDHVIKSLRAAGGARVKKPAAGGGRERRITLAAGQPAQLEIVLGQ